MIKAKSFLKRSSIRCSSELAYKWHINQFSFERLVPPWESVNLIDWERPIKDGSQAHFEIKLGPLTLSWLATHHGVVPGKTFSDKQTKGPFQYWNHKHSFIEDAEDSFILEDKIEYRVPVGPLGSIVTDGAIEAKIRKGFNYRHETTKKDLELLTKNANLERKNPWKCRFWPIVTSNYWTIFPNTTCSRNSLLPTMTFINRSFLPVNK